MNIIKSVLEHFSKKNNKEENSSPEGVCPNCWGRQEWDSKYYEAVLDRQIDVNNGNANYAFIQDFIVNNIDGITLQKNQGGYTCPTCKHSS